MCLIYKQIRLSLGEFLKLDRQKKKTQEIQKKLEKKNSQIPTKNSQKTKKTGKKKVNFSDYFCKKITYATPR